MVALQGMLIAALGIGAVVAVADAQPLTLEQVIRDVCTKSDSVKMMKESLYKSEQMVREKRANALPVVAATGAYAHNYGSAFGSSSSSGSRSMAKTKSAPGPDDPVTWRALDAMMGQFSSMSDPANSDIYSAGVSFNQPIYTFGKISNAIKVARNFNNSARASYERGIQGLQLDAFDAYFRVFLAENALDAAKRSLERKMTLNLFLDRNFKNGSGSRAQVLQTKADVTSQQAVIIEAQRDAGMVRMNLNRMTARALTDTCPLDTQQLPARLADLTVPDAADAVRTALANRRDIHAVRYLAESNRGGAKIMKTMYYPTIGANGSLGYSKMDSDNSMFKTDGNPNWMLGVGVQWTMFDGFANSARSAQYLSDARKFETLASTLEKTTEMEIRAAIIECAAADSSEIALTELLAALREGYLLTKVDFEQGSGRLIELQQAEERLQQTELAMASARYRTLRSRAALMVAMGENIVKMEGSE